MSKKLFKMNMEKQKVIGWITVEESEDYLCIQDPIDDRRWCYSYLEKASLDLSEKLETDVALIKAQLISSKGKASKQVYMLKMNKEYGLRLYFGRGGWTMRFSPMESGEKVSEEEQKKLFKTFEEILSELNEFRLLFATGVMDSFSYNISKRKKS